MSWKDKLKAFFAVPPSRDDGYSPPMPKYPPQRPKPLAKLLSEAELSRMAAFAPPRGPVTVLDYDFRFNWDPTAPIGDDDKVIVLTDGFDSGLHNLFLAFGYIGALDTLLKQGHNAAQAQAYLERHALSWL